MNKFIYSCQLCDIIIHILESGHFDKITQKLIMIIFSFPLVSSTKVIIINQGTLIL